MASSNLLKHTDSCFESPAKVFAKLKSKVQKEAMCVKEGSLTSKDLSSNVSEKDKAQFHSPRRKTASTGTAEELKENQKFSSYLNEAQALTLSPISSPQKTFDYTCSVISNRPLEETSGDENVRGYTRRDRAVLESTAVSHPLSLVNRDQIDKQTHQIIDMGCLNEPNRTPVKSQPVKNYGKDVFDAKCGPLTKPMSPGNVFSPMTKRLRKRKWELQEFTKDCRTTKEKNEDIQLPQERKTSGLVKENSCLQDFGNVRGSSSNQPERLHEPVFSPRSAIEKCCSVTLETFPITSPAKMFAYMKERENRKERQEAHNNSKRDLFGQGNLRHSRDTPLSRAHKVGEMEHIACGSAPEMIVSASPCRADSTECPSDTDHSEDVLTPAASSHPVLLEDPLVLNSPQISIPKPVFKRNCWPKQKKFPLENVIYLKKWFLRKNRKGLFVDGIHNEDNIPWNSNIIVDRISRSVLRTISGKVYILVGKMKMDAASEFPQWLLKKFASGFPHNWKMLYEQFLQEAREAERNNEGSSSKAKTAEESSINQSVNGHKQKSTKTPEFHPPTSSSSAKVSRSGRIIKPPLDYWKGGRVILDAQMNVTIHEGYDTCQSGTSTLISPRSSETSVRVMVRSSKGCKQSKSAKDERTSGPVRRVNAVHKHQKDVVRSYKKPVTLIEPAVEMLSSPEEWCGRITRSSQRLLHLATERGLYVNAGPQKQSEPSVWRSKRQPHDINRPSVHVSGRKQTITNSPESPPVDNKAVEHFSSDEDFSTMKKRTERVCVKKRGKDHKLQPDHKPSANRPPEYSEEGRKAQRKRTREARKPDEARTKHKESRSTERSPQEKPLLKSKQSSKKGHPNKGSTIIPQDEDAWTETELMALQEAVSYYPKNIRGYWANVARMVGTRSAEECHKQHTSMGTSHTPAKRANKRVPAPKPAVAERPVISAGVGTFKRKQQVRQFLESQPKEDVDDAFSSAYMQNKRFEIPSLCLSDDQDVQMLDLEPQTPKSSHFLEVKTPQCLHITPGMMGSPNANNDDKFVYQLQKRMKKNQFNVRKNSASSKKFTPTPSLEQKMRRCVNTENDAFVIWEMLAENDGALSESGEEDFYFSDD